MSIELQTALIAAVVAFTVMILSHGIQAILTTRRRNRELISLLKYLSWQLQECRAMGYEKPIYLEFRSIQQIVTDGHLGYFPKGITQTLLAIMSAAQMRNNLLNVISRLRESRTPEEHQKGIKQDIEFWGEALAKYAGRAEKGMQSLLDHLGSWKAHIPFNDGPDFECDQNEPAVSASDHLPSASSPGP